MKLLVKKLCSSKYSNETEWCNCWKKYLSWQIMQNLFVRPAFKWRVMEIRGKFGSQEFPIGFMLWCSRIGAFLKKFGPQTINVWAMWAKLRRKNCPCRRFRAHGLFCDRPNPVSQNGPWTKHTAQMNTSCVGKDAHARWPSINTKISRHTDSDVENETTSLQPGIHSTPCATQPVIHRTRCVMLGLGLFTQNLLLGGDYQKEAQPVDQNGRAAQILFQKCSI